MLQHIFTITAALVCAAALKASTITFPAAYGSGYTTFYDTVGYGVLVTSNPIAVTQLSSIGAANAVGLWDTNGNLIAYQSNSVATSGTWNLGTPVLLTTNTQYILGAANTKYGSLLAHSYGGLNQSGFPSSYVSAPDISLVGVARNNQSWVFSKPTIQVGAGSSSMAIEGPNITYTILNPSIPNLNSYPLPSGFNFPGASGGSGYSYTAMYQGYRSLLIGASGGGNIFTGTTWTFSDSPVNNGILTFSIYDAYGGSSSPYYMHVNMISSNNTVLGINWLDSGWRNPNYDVNVVGVTDPSFHRNLGWNKFTIQWTSNNVKVSCNNQLIVNTSILQPFNATSLTFVMHDYYGGSQQYGVKDISLTQFGSLLSQTITFNAPSPVTYGGSSFNLSASASSGLPVTFTSSSPGVASVTGSNVTINGAGSTTITASQAGNGTYAAASSVSQTLVVNQAPQTISFSPIPTQTYGIGTYNLAATDSSGLPIIYTSSNLNVAVVNGSTLTIVGAGTANITAYQAGNANYLATNFVEALLVQPADQTIPAFSIPNHTFGDAPFAVTPPTSSSGLPVTLTVQSGPATIANNVVTLTGAGTVVIAANQRGNSNYNAAPQITSSISVAQAPQTITLQPLPAYATYGDAPIILTATTSSGLPVVFSSSNGSILSISANVATIVGAGNVTVTASQAGDSNYLAATSVSAGLMVYPKTTLYAASARGTITALSPTNSLSSTIATVLAAPTALISDASGTLYVANAYRNSIYKIATNGSVTTFSTNGLSMPYGLALDTNGTLFAANMGNNSIVRYDSNGIATIYSTNGLYKPIGIAFDASGNLYAANSANGTIRKITPNGLSTNIVSGLSTPYAIAVDGSGSLLVACKGDNSIRKITANGAVSLFTTNGLSAPQALCFDGYGSLYAANFANSTLSKYDASGNLIGKLTNGISAPMAVTSWVRPALLSGSPGLPGLTNGLLVYYPFRGDFYDYSGNKNTAINRGSGFTTNRFGMINGALMVGYNSGALSTTNVGLGTGTDFTVSLWVKPYETNPWPSGSMATLFLPQNDTVVGRVASFVYKAYDPQNLVIDTGYSGAQVTSQQTNLVGTWSQLLYTYTASNSTYTIYMNGVQQTQNFSQSGSINLSNTVLTISGVNGIGDTNGGGLPRGINGAISDVRVYNRALTTNEVSALYQYESTSGN